MNIILHAGVCLLLWGIMRRLRIREGAQAAALWLFAAHPVHVESVTWISGSTDLLCGDLSCRLAVCLSDGGRRSAGACGSPTCFTSRPSFQKKRPVLFPGVIFVCGIAVMGDSKSKALRETLPFGAAALIFLVTRSVVLQGLSLVYPLGPGLSLHRDERSAPFCVLPVPVLCPLFSRAFLRDPRRDSSDAGIHEFRLAAAVLACFAFFA